MNKLISLSILVWLSCGSELRESIFQLQRVSIRENTTGTGISEGMKNKIVAIINNGFSEWKDNYRQNCEYISLQLKSNYGGYGFSVVIIGEDQSSSNWFGHMNNNFWLQWKAVNKMRVQWTYFIWAINSLNVNSLNYIDNYGYGEGMTLDQLNHIENIVVDSEKGHPTCDCQAIFDISFALNKLDNFSWSVVCRPSNLNYMHGMVSNLNQRYVMLSPAEAKC